MVLIALVWIRPWLETFYLQIAPYHYLSTSQHTCTYYFSISLSLSLFLSPPPFSLSFSQGSLTKLSLPRCVPGSLALLEQDVVTPPPILWSRTQKKLSGARDHRPEKVSTESRRAARGYHYLRRYRWWDQEDKKQAHNFHSMSWFPQKQKKKKKSGLAAPTLVHRTLARL